MIKIGIIGMSPGNAHPYSWSAIINGVFDGHEISKIGYPAVTDYLVANSDTVGLNNAQVTHVWSQKRSISESIARTAQIPYVVDQLDDLVGRVDAVILARDDAENHVSMAQPFLDVGIPIFIDKPLALNREDLTWFSEQHTLGKLIMSCSSMRYASECRTVKTELTSLGKIDLVTAVGKKDWPKYGVHLLEAIFSTLDDPTPISVQYLGEEKKHIVHVILENGIHITLHLFQDISSTFQFSIFGQDGWKLVDIRNSYAMFRDNIIEFLRSVEEGNSRLAFYKTENILHTLIGSLESLDQGGKIIRL